MDSAPPLISAIIPASCRTDALVKTLGRILNCDPRPAEILVHLDGNHPDVRKAVQSSFPAVRLLSSTSIQGPGGSRNILLREARHEWVANFDDDSFPESSDYFARVIGMIEAHPTAAVLSSAGPSNSPEETAPMEVAWASGCGCVYRKSWFEKTGGFVPLPIAYCMEEVDLGLRIHAMGGKIILDPCLRVIHDKPYATHVEPTVNAAILANTALFAFLRYPVWLWPLGAIQLVTRIRFLISKRWTKGIVSGLAQIPSHLWRHRRYRNPLPSRLIRSWFQLRHRPFPISSQA